VKRTKNKKRDTHKIHIDYLDVPIGHRRDQGCGAHNSEPHRLRTRATKEQAAIKEWDHES
jgi:hypothetical protein